MHVATTTFTPSLYIPLQAITFTPIYTMEINNSFGKIEKFIGRPGTISLKEFKATFSTMVCELELKYGPNYIEAFAFKQLTRYVHYEALDIYEQHSPKILGVTKIPNPSYATTIATAFQATLQTTIENHGTVPIILIRYILQYTFLFNNSLLILQKILPPSTHQLLLSQWVNYFEFLSYNFELRFLKKICNSPPSLSKRMKPSRCSTRGFSSLKKIIRASQTWKLPIGIFIRWKVVRHSMRRFWNRFL
jgi:hypothetical protein